MAGFLCLLIGVRVESLFHPGMYEYSTSSLRRNSLNRLLYLLFSPRLSMCLSWDRNECELGAQPTETSQGSVLSCSDSGSELGHTDPQTSTTDTPVLEAEAPSVVPLGAADTPAPPLKTEDSPSAARQDAPKPFIPASDSFINSLVSDRDKTSTPQSSITEEVEEPSTAPILPTLDAAGHDVPWMNVDLEGAEAARCARAAGQSLDDGSAAATYAVGTLETSQGIGEEDGPVWTWISGGGCDVDANSQISWLSPTGTRTTSMLSF